MKKLPSVESVETLSLGAMRKLVAGLVAKSHEYEAEFATLRLFNERQRLEIERLILDNERLRLENDTLRLDNQMLRDEIARLKNLPPRPPFKPSGMEKGTQPKTGKVDKKHPRGAKRDRNGVTREVTLAADVPDGSRFKGYKRRRR